MTCMATLFSYCLNILSLPINSLSRRMMMKVKMRPICPDSSPLDCCVVCLSDIIREGGGPGGGEDDDEIPRVEELKCKHVFHKKCLERWMKNKGTTCPLCRDPLQLRTGDGGGRQDHIAVCFFPYHLSESGHHEDNWWIR